MTNRLTDLPQSFQECREYRHPWKDVNVIERGGEVEPSLAPAALLAITTPMRYEGDDHEEINAGCCNAHRSSERDGRDWFGSTGCVRRHPGSTVSQLGAFKWRRGPRRLVDRLRSRVLRHERPLRHSVSPVRTGRVAGTALYRENRRLTRVLPGQDRRPGRPAAGFYWPDKVTSMTAERASGSWRWKGSANILRCDHGDPICPCGCMCVWVSPRGWACPHCDVPND